MSNQNPRQLSLAELEEGYNNMLEIVRLLDGEIKDRLESILNREKIYIEELLNSPDRIRTEVDQHLASAKPFEWNRIKSAQIDEENLRKDWEQHDSLVTFAVIFDDKSFLKKWGVEYPLLDHDSPGLANPSSEYIGMLEASKQQSNNTIYKDYYGYLISELTFCLRKASTAN